MNGFIKIEKKNAVSLNMQSTFPQGRNILITKLRVSLYSKDGKDFLLHQMHTLCIHWGITLNVDKTIITAFISGNR